MRPNSGRGDADSHLWPCPQCGTANGLNALACWNCEAVLKPVPPDELPAPITASLAERGILERVADLREGDPSREMAFAEGPEEDAWSAARTSDRWARAGCGADSRHDASGEAPVPDVSSAARGAPPPNEPDRRASDRPAARVDSPHHRSVEAFLALWRQRDDEPERAAEPTGQVSIDPEAAHREAVEPVEGGPSNLDLVARREDAAPRRTDPPAEAVQFAPEGADAAGQQAAESLRVDIATPSTNHGAEIAPKSEAAPGLAEHPPIETFEYPSSADAEHPPIRIDADDSAADAGRFSFGPDDHPVQRGPAVDAFGPLPSARGESDPFHDAALGERFAELAAASARSARRRRHVTLVATGLLLAALAVVAYSIFEGGVHVDLSADELRSAATGSTTAGSPDAAKVAVEPAAPPMTSISQATPPPGAGRAEPPTAAPDRQPNGQRPGRTHAPIVAAPAPTPTATPNAVPATRSARTPPPAVIERFERRQPAPANAAAAETTTAQGDAPRAETASPTPAGARAGDGSGDANASITCTERILALGLCGPEPSTRKD